MDMKITTSGNKAAAEIGGSIDAKTSPELERALLALPADIKALDLDLTDVVYISSAGLRMLLTVHQHYNDRGGSLTIIGARDEINEIFEITGIDEFLNIKD